MAKLTLAVAALLVASVASTRVRAQSEQFVSDDQTAFVQEVPAAAAVDVPAAVAADAEALVTTGVAEPDAADVTTPVVVEAPTPVAVEVAVATGPTTHAATLSPRLSSDVAFSTHAMRRPSRGSGVGLMIFGGAALITGLIIGDGAGTVIAVGGALVGLYGLYVYLGRPTGMGNGQASHSERIGLGYKLNTN